MFDTSIAMLSLVVGGILDACPRLQVVHPHLGGTLPFLAGRVETYRRAGLWPGLTEPIAGYLRRVWLDTVSATPEALALVRELAGDDHLLFATDYPYWTFEAGMAFVREHVPADRLAAVCHHNAETLLGLPGRGDGRAADGTVDTVRSAS